MTHAQEDEELFIMATACVTGRPRTVAPPRTLEDPQVFLRSLGDRKWQDMTSQRRLWAWNASRSL